jgi:hypothetical protein
MKLQTENMEKIILIAIPLISLLLVWFFDPGYVVAIVLFYLLPALYLLVGNKTPIGKMLIFSSIISIPFFVIVDYIGTISGIWEVPQSPFRLLGVLPLEDYLWLLCGTVLILVYYSVKSPQPKPMFINFKVLTFGSIVALSLFTIIYQIFPSTLVWSGKFSYLLLGSLFFLLPGLLISMRYPGLIKEELKIIPYFLYTTLSFEMIATHQGYWIFTGDYIFSPLTIAGIGLVPLEELFFVGVAGPIAAVAFYKLLSKR